MAFVKLSRPHFLIGGFLMFGLGAATAAEIDVSAYLLAQAMVTAAQVTAHYANEYADVESDRAVRNRTLFSGGSGVLVGALAPVVALRAAQASTFVAVGFAAVLVVPQPGAASLGIAAVAVSWAYSMPPIRLLETGWGEAWTSLVVVGMVPMIGALSQGGPITGVLAWSIVILFPIHMAMMLAFEIPDLETDAATGKTVLAVRLGRQATVRAIVALLGLAALLVIASLTSGGLTDGAAWSLPVLLVAGVGIHGAARGLRHGLVTTLGVAALAGVATVLLLVVTG